MPTFVDIGVSRGQRRGTLTVVNLNFVDRSRYIFFQVAPHLSSQGLSRPCSRPTATQKIWYRRESNPGPLEAARNSDHQTTEAVVMYEPSTRIKSRVIPVTSRGGP
jgi:hypothetical protein